MERQYISGRHYSLLRVSSIELTGPIWILGVLLLRGEGRKREGRRVEGERREMGGKGEGKEREKGREGRRFRKTR